MGARMIVGGNISQRDARRERGQRAGQLGEYLVQAIGRLPRVRREEAQLRPGLMNAVQEPEELDVGDTVLGHLLDALSAARTEDRAFGGEDIGDPLDALDMQRVTG